MHPSLHSFHIPVMGLAFTIDSPVKVAKFGISSVVSIIEDRLIESMRKYYYEQNGLKFKPIPTRDPDHRAKRVTDYLNLLNKIVQQQVEQLRNSAFERGSELAKYFEMLPSDSKLGNLYRRMHQTENEQEKKSLEIFLKSQVKAGSIDANIMTKVDKNNYDHDGNEMVENSDALASLRGYASSDLTNSSLIFSAGMNPRLFNYLEKFSDFDALGWGEFKKKIVIKVSDFRSALIQGKILAKKGIWVSEFRIESGLNCGGHAFATDGYLLGPILQEFKDKRDFLIDELHKLYLPAAENKGKPVFTTPHPIRITVQGGIGTAEEDSFLRNYYQTDATGWGTPFLLCPEATTVDEATLELLQGANQDSISLSKNSPLGIRFHHLKGTTADIEKQNRIRHGRPGSPCTEKHLVTNTEFTVQPICTASRTYQVLKIEQLKTLGLSEEEFAKKSEDVLAKECLCVGLSNSAQLVYDAPFLKKLNSVTICPGPNIVYFNKIVSLQEMTDHIYGRTSLISNDRPHMFINELKLYVDYLSEQISATDLDAKQTSYCTKFSNNLLEGISYYKNICNEISAGERFYCELIEYEAKIRSMMEISEPEKVSSES
jgi:hypothetical protein